MPKNAVKSNVPDEIILTKILFIRGRKVMIDRDLAELYGVSTKRLNEQVKLLNPPEEPRPRIGFRRKDEQN
jgi:hypothetical protein